MLDSIENQLRWPEALGTLKPGLNPAASAWADKVINERQNYDSQPKPW